MAALPAGVAVNIDAKTVIEDAVGPPHRRTAPKPAEAARLADAGADAFCVDDVPGVLAALAGSGQACR
jgi:hypothetical protein